MSIELWFIVGAGVILLLVIGVIVRIKRPRKLKVDRFTDRWKSLQGYCRDKKTWRLAIIDADKLLDEALKRRKFKGKSMGERLVSAQRKFTNNDGVWSAHNLAKKVIASDTIRLKEEDVKAALVNFRQALKDIGALDNGESRNA